MKDSNNVTSEEQISLKTAHSYIEEVEKRLESFKETIQSESQKSDTVVEEGGFITALGIGLKSG